MYIVDAVQTLNLRTPFTCRFIRSRVAKGLGVRIWGLGHKEVWVARFRV